MILKFILHTCIPLFSLTTAFGVLVHDFHASVLATNIFYSAIGVHHDNKFVPESTPHTHPNHTTINSQPFNNAGHHIPNTPPRPHSQRDDVKKLTTRGYRMFDNQFLPLWE